MALLKREEWYDLARDTNWTAAYVPGDELFPEPLSGAMGISAQGWEAWDEPYKMTFREYIETQREKDSGAYSVKAALSRGQFFDQAPEGWKSVLKSHYGAFALPEYEASVAEARMARFSRAPGNRNMALFGILDEIRHGQIQLYFPHEHCSKDRQFDWAYKALQTESWGSIAIRHLFDDMMMTRSATETAVMLTFAVESGFTNLQFLALAADAARTGDMTFSTLISSVQTDESRHAQQGAATLRVLIDNGKKAEAQKMIDIIFWRSWRAFCLITGQAMDYYTPLAHRTRSFKEFVSEFIVEQFVRAIEDLGLDKPWYWDHFLASADHYQHGMHLGVWLWRQTVWWNPRAGVTPAERDWLEKKYPGWNDTYGRCWDVITENGLQGRRERWSPTTFPVVCNMCCIPVVGVAGAGWDGPGRPLCHPLDHQNRRYIFCSEECRWIFQQEPERYQGHLGFIDRVLAGMVPPDLEGALRYMGLAPGERGDDAEDGRWVESHRRAAEAAE